MARTNVWNHGRMHVQAEMCATCIFRPGNKMQLRRGRVRAMVDEAKADDGTIPCHETIAGQRKQQAICRGFYDNHPTPTLELAKRMGVIAEC